MNKNYFNSGLNTLGFFHEAAVLGYVFIVKKKVF